MSMMINPYRFGDDPNFSSVKLLLHMNGSDGATSFVDSSSSAHTFTASGNAQVDTGIVKYGSGALLLDGTGDYLSAPDSDDFAFGSGDFTIEGWIYPTSTGNRRIVSQQTAAGNWFVRQNTTGPLAFNASGVVTIIGSTTLAANTWQHFAVVRNGTSFKLYLNGTEDGSATSANSLANVAAALNVGRDGQNNAEYFIGSIDDIRITKGVARYTANFTPPAAEFPDY